MTLANKREVLDHVKRFLQTYVDAGTVDKEGLKQLTKTAAETCVAPVSTSVVELHVLRGLLGYLEASNSSPTEAVQQVREELRAAEACGAQMPSTPATGGQKVEESGVAVESEHEGTVAPLPLTNGDTTAGALVAATTAGKRFTVSALKERMMKRKAELEASKAARLQSGKPESDRSVEDVVAPDAVSTGVASGRSSQKRSRSAGDDGVDVHDEMVSSGPHDDGQSRKVLEVVSTTPNDLSPIPPTPTTISPALGPVPHVTAEAVVAPEIPLLPPTDNDYSVVTQDPQPKYMRVETAAHTTPDAYDDDLYGDVLANMNPQRGTLGGMGGGRGRGRRESGGRAGGTRRAGKRGGRFTLPYENGAPVPSVQSGEPTRHAYPRPPSHLQPQRGYGSDPTSNPSASYPVAPFAAPPLLPPNVLGSVRNGGSEGAGWAPSANNYATTQ